MVYEFNAAAQTLITLHDFTKGADGFAPMSPLAIGKDGAIYGTSQGGAGGFGMICKIAP